jgi:integrase
MAREPGKLTALQVEKIKTPGRYNDGGGLYLQVSGAAAAKSWIFRFRLPGHTSKNGKPLSREMGLGSLYTTGLKDARIKAAQQRLVLVDHIDPLEAQRERRLRNRLEAATAMTFRQVAEAYIAAHRAGWRNVRHAEQWPLSLGAYAFPIFGDVPVQAIDTALVLKVLQPIWTTKPETASRLRGRIELILGYAKAVGYRTGENSARWRDHLDKLLPRVSKIHKVKHHAAMDYTNVAAFMAELDQRSTIAARALQFLVYTAARTGEVTGAKWSEIDGTARVWSISADRMKANRPHRVPLSDGAMAVLGQMKLIRKNDCIFPGEKGEHLSRTSMKMLRRRMGVGDEVTIHGFRASFKTWATERTSFPHEVIEAALAHATGDKVEQAYQRSDMFEKRKRLMAAWSEFCGRQQKQADVVQLRASGA